MFKVLTKDLRDRWDLDLSECFMDGSFVIAKKQGAGKTKWGKGAKIKAVVDCTGLPISISAVSASPHEVRLVKMTLESSFVDVVPFLSFIINLEAISKIPE